MLLGGVSSSGLARATQAPPPRPVKPIDALPWKELRESLSGSVLRPGEPGYAKAAAPWNGRFADRLPGGVARCRTAEEVQAALLWARTYRVPISVRAGGLSQAGYSNTRGLIIDVSLMSAAVVDPQTGLLTAQAGARHSDLFAAMRQAGVAITHGHSPHIGLAGLVLGGGVGLNMRRHGLACDQLLEAEMVDAGGLVKKASREQNADLFWALRGGGGGNFGICTRFKLQTFPVADLTVFRLVWKRELDDVLPTLLSVLPEAGPELGCQVTVSVSAGGALSLELLGQTSESPDDLLGMLEPAYQLAAPFAEDVQVLPYWQAQDLLVDSSGSQCFQERSRYLYAGFPIEGSDLVLKGLRAWPGTAGAARWRAQLTGGAVDKVNRRATAYVHRGATMLSSLQLSWKAKESEERIQANLAWLDELHQSLAPMTSEESYQNYADPSLQNFAQAYYGENLIYLSVLKRRLDPEGVFDFEQGVPS